MAGTYSCKQCGQSFGSNDELEQHNQKMHMAGTGGGSMGGGMGRGGMGGMDAGESGTAGGDKGDKGRTQGDVGKERR
ncbi:MAG TPA: hypothetical protein VFA01_03085 [Candidatus Dormibacteraeota bacterium]|jgi:hypothetical protein|nr:hypothetical protein [Candidatus Dormibacteraeota bacterium]